MFVTAIQWQIQDQLSGGYHVTSRSVYTEYCDESWYKVMFFYANLELSGEHPEALGCMGHLWYIQCDMQMYLLLPWVLLLFVNHKTLGLAASALPVGVCVLIRFIYAFYYDFTANTLYPGYPAKHGGNQDVDSYYKPWTRMSPYFIGVAAMLTFIWIDEEFKNGKRGNSKKLSLPKALYFLCVVTSCFILASLVFWPYQDVVNAPRERWSLLANQMYFALSKPAWGSALALLCFALKYKSDEDGQRSLIKAFLSLSIYQCLGKLTYLMYLLHLIVFAWWALDLELPAYYDEWTEVLLVIGVWAITAFISVILWLFMEKPLSNLTTALLKAVSGGNKKKKALHPEALHEPLNKRKSMPTSIDGGNDDEECYDHEQTLKEHSMMDSYDESKSKQPGTAGGKHFN